MKSLKQIRKVNGLTQQELSVMTGVHRVLISRAEQGLIRPNLTTRQRLEAALGHIDWLEGRPIQTKTGDYFKAESIVKRLVCLTSTLDGEEREAINQLISKYFNKP